MNVEKITISKQLSSFRISYLPFLLKDVLFRLTFESFYHTCIFYEYYSKLRSQRSIGIKVEDTLSQQLHHESSRYIHYRSGLFILGVCISSLVTHPLDVITTRLIAQQKDIYSNMFDCMKTIIKEEGI